MRSLRALLDLVLAALLIAGCRGGGGDSGLQSAAPLANAGTAQSVVSRALVTRNGGDRTDAGGDSLTHS